MARSDNGNGNGGGNGNGKGPHPFDPERDPAPSYDVAGVRIHALTVGHTVEIIDRWIRQERREYIVLTGAHGVVEMQSDDELRAINNHAGLTTPDGMPVVWLGRLAGYEFVKKVAAPDIMRAIFAVSAERGLKHFLYGGHEGVAEQLKAKLEQRHPGIEIVGTYYPPFRPLTDEETREVSAQIDASGADIVWCGLGCPKQERWMAQFRELVRAPVLIGVGAGFDFFTDRVPMAPEWLRHSGFEWLYRLARDPTRLWPRYSRVVPKFIYRVAAQHVRDKLPG